VKFVAAAIAAVVLACVGAGYAVHEHHAAQNLAAKNQQMSVDLASTRSQIDALTAKVSELATRAAAEAAPAQPASAPTTTTASSHPGKPHASRAADRRLTKMQQQLDAQNKAIEETRGDLASTRTELSGSIAHTHDELVVLEKKGERSYFEFDIQKSKQFQHEGPIGISLRKADTKHQFADLQLMVEDRNLIQKHVNLDQPIMFYQPDTEQPIQIVINDITKDHIHGYVSAPKYRKSELASMGNANANPDANANPADGIVGDAQSAPRKKLTVPPQD
jgi:TolA-binding protein